jgi:hypothetical protein
MYGVFVSAFAVLSLFVSSVSACACAHHQQKVETAPSCHVQSHSGHSETAQTTDAKTSIDEGCSCFVNVPSPYILAKSGKKKVAEQGPVAELPVSLAFTEPDFSAVEISAQPAVADPNLYLSLLRVSKPARAPPRL